MAKNLREVLAMTPAQQEERDRLQKSLRKKLSAHKATVQKPKSVQAGAKARMVKVEAEDEKTPVSTAWRSRIQNAGDVFKKRITDMVQHGAF